jgi:quercetin dioxygenase-like cupin family protein
LEEIFKPFYDVKRTLDLRKVFGVTATFESGQSRSGPFEMEVMLEPGGKSSLHIHPHQQELYDVKEGEFEIYLNGKWNRVTAGQQILIPRAVKHGFRNAGTQTVAMLNTHFPALRTEEYFETLQTLINEDKLTGITGFKNSIYLALHTVKFADVVKVYQPPNAWIKAGAFFGKILGYKI